MTPAVRPLLTVPSCMFHRRATYLVSQPRTASLLLVRALLAERSWIDVLNLSVGHKGSQRRTCSYKELVNAGLLR